MRGCYVGTMSAESHQRALELVTNYRKATQVPTPEQVEALYKGIMRRVFGKEKD